MPQYALFMYQPVDREVSQEGIAQEYPRWQQFDEDIKAAGAFVDNRGLAATDASTTVRVREGQTQVTDGPFAETKEYLAGYYLIEVPDLDGALEWAAKIPSAEYGSVEIRPMWGAS
jgi:hypothetical protein